MDKTEQILLENQIKRLSYEYYALGKPSLSDADFDRLYDELHEKYPESDALLSIGNDMQEGFPKAEHIITMGSQEKLKTIEQIDDWIAKKHIQFPVYLEWKYDGISIELQYDRGILVSAVTRGN